MTSFVVVTSTRAALTDVVVSTLDRDYPVLACLGYSPVDTTLALSPLTEMAPVTLVDGGSKIQAKVNASIGRYSHIMFWQPGQGGGFVWRVTSQLQQVLHLHSPGTAVVTAMLWAVRETPRPAPIPQQITFHTPITKESLWTRTRKNLSRRS